MTVTSVVNSKDLPEGHQGFIKAYWNYGPQGPLYYHYKGGIYQIMCEGKLTDDASDVIIYKHLYPHTPGVWVRNKEEFETPGKFSLIAHKE